MWCESIDVIGLLRTSRLRAALSHNLAKELADAHERSLSMILTSEEAIFDSDQFIRQNWNYCAGPANPISEPASEADPFGR